MIVFPVLFGISMDYEVFLISRIRESYDTARDTRTAVLVDATVVRLILVPASMELLGRANWWIPRWLDRILPAVHTHHPTQTNQHPA